MYTCVHTSSLIYISLLPLGTAGTNQDDRDVIPAGRLANIYAESKEFLLVKQQLDQKLELALNEPVGKTPQFTTNFLWQVNFIMYVLLYSIYIYIYIYKINKNLKRE